MTTSAHATWLTGADLADLPAAQAPFALALVCDVLDPAFTACVRLAPTDDDRADEQAPSASSRTHFRARRALLRTLVGRAVGVDPAAVRVRYDAHGAPRVLDRPVFVSVSSRGPLAALAVASAPVGIDLELFDAGVEPVDAVLAPQERATLARLRGVERARAFLRIWTAKEACLKALGLGLKRDPATLAAMCAATTFTVMQAHGRGQGMAGAFAPASVAGDLVVACATAP